jgi:hypothetical protein
MRFEAFGVVEPPLGQALDQCDAPSRGFGFVPVQTIGRTVRKAQTALDALIGRSDELLLQG